MRSTFDLEEIKVLYKQYYEEAVAKGIKYLPWYEIQRWDKVLNEVERRTFEDIRFIGLPLYPIYPVLETTYLNFANPFKRVGIEIVCKTSPQGMVDRKINFLEAGGWKIYTITSKDTYLTIEEFFRIKRTNKSVDWEDLSNSMRARFAEKYHTENGVCLLYHIKYNHFSDEVMSEYY